MTILQDETEAQAPLITGRWSCLSARVEGSPPRVPDLAEKLYLGQMSAIRRDEERETERLLAIIATMSPCPPDEPDYDPLDIPSLSLAEPSFDEEGAL